MQLRHILAATDESDAGRQAVRTAMDLASRGLGRVTILRDRASSGGPGVRRASAARGLRRW